LEEKKIKRKKNLKAKSYLLPQFNFHVLFFDFNYVNKQALQTARLSLTVGKQKAGCLKNQVT